MNLSLLTGFAFFFPYDRNINANDKPPTFVKISLLGEPMGDPLTLFKLKISNAITSREVVMATPRSYIERQTSIFTLDDVTALQPLSPPDVTCIKKLFWLSSFFNQLFEVQDPLEKCQENSPLPVLGNSVHISFTPSNTMLQWRSKAFTLPSSFLLFLSASS